MIVPGTAIEVPDLTQTQLRVLREMVEALERESADDEYEDGEIVIERGEAWRGLRRLSLQTVYALLRACAISSVTGNEPGAHVERYVANETGRTIVQALV